MAYLDPPEKVVCAGGFRQTESCCFGRPASGTQVFLFVKKGMQAASTDGRTNLGVMSIIVCSVIVSVVVQTKQCTLSFQKCAVNAEPDRDPTYMQGQDVLLSLGLLPICANPA